MEWYYEIFLNNFRGYATYLWHEVLHLHWGNYFYWLIAISLAVYALELLFPWRKNQPALRRDFWLDGFYMFFNFFLFSLVGYAAVSSVCRSGFQRPSGFGFWYPQPRGFQLGFLAALGPIADFVFGP